MKIDHSTIWSVDHGPDDITHLMRCAIGAKLHELLGADEQIGDGARFLTDDDATHSGLIGHLSSHRPGFIITTSHGMTGPLGDPAAMRDNLGLPVDQNRDVLDPDQLLANWQPAGAIWLAQACCSAGNDAESSMAPLFPPDSDLGWLLGEMTNIGSMIAPLPRRLLGSDRPARAFIGHVEPTFDWTIRQPKTGQYLTDSLIKGMYEGLFQRVPKPVGLALRPWFDPIGALAIAYDQEVSHNVLADAPLDYAMWCQLAIRDRGSLVVIGDPAALLPPLERSSE
jgi:hypothetical protein